MPEKRKKVPVGDACRVGWFDRVPVPMFILDQKGKMLYANHACETVTGQRKTDLLGRTLEEFVIDSDSRRYVNDTLKLFRGSTLDRVSYDLRRRDKKIVHTIATVTPVFDAKNQRVEYAVGIVVEHEIH